MQLLLNSRRILILSVLLITTTILYILYVKKDRRDFIKNYKNDEVDDEQVRHQLLQTTRKMSKIKFQIKQFNTKLEIHNSNLGPISKKTFVIVIQCHSNIDHVRRLLGSLKKAYFINKALLIFSHDHFSQKMNQLILKIDFAQYMQIFYPYSMQTHPGVFPGREYISCPKGFFCDQSPRDPEAAQSKHHWWWQANQVFDHISELEKFTKPILFLEANNYVLLDFLFVFRLLVNARNTHCTFCEMISLAAHTPEISKYKKRKSLVTLEAWKDTTPSTAIAFDRQVWHSIKDWKELFCFYNDSSWDTSLKHLGIATMHGNIYFAAIDGPRVFRIEECHPMEVNCNEGNKLKAVQKFTRLVSKQLFPQSVRIKVPGDEESNPIESGNWGDVRDQELCLRFANESVWFSI